MECVHCYILQLSAIKFTDRPPLVTIRYNTTLDLAQNLLSHTIDFPGHFCFSFLPTICN